MSQYVIKGLHPSNVPAEIRVTETEDDKQPTCHWRIGDHSGVTHQIDWAQRKIRDFLPLYSDIEAKWTWVRRYENDTDHTR